MRGDNRSRRRGTTPEQRELKELAHDPPAQSRRAAQLLAPKHGLGVHQAALSTLIVTPNFDAKPDLFALYQHYTKQSTRDPACFVRSQIVLALRPLVAPTDAPFFWDAGHTFVFPPPEFAEAGGLLRANALLVLSELDDSLAAYMAARLLADHHTAPMSGEPAVTAALVLAQLGELLPLYLYVMQRLDAIVPEVGAQALRGLANLPEPMLSQTLARYCAPGSPESAAYRDEGAISPPLITGLIDLLVGCDPIPPMGMTFLQTFLRENSPLDLYRYLATILATSGQESAWSLLEQVVADEDVPIRRAVLRDALGVALDPARAKRLLRRLAEA